MVNLKSAWTIHFKRALVSSPCLTLCTSLRTSTTTLKDTGTGHDKACKINKFIKVTVPYIFRKMYCVTLTQLIFWFLHLLESHVTLRLNVTLGLFFMLPVKKPPWIINIFSFLCSFTGLNKLGITKTNLFTMKYLRATNLQRNVLFHVECIFVFLPYQANHVSTFGWEIRISDDSFIWQFGRIVRDGASPTNQISLQTQSSGTLPR